MNVQSVIVSSGHGKYVRGAAGVIDEVDEARLVTDRLQKDFALRGIDCKVFHDNVSSSQSENLNRITDFHNQNVRDLDLSIHFNAYEQVDHAMGVEVLYLTEGALAGEVSAAIAEAGGLKNRGAKRRDDLHFLNCTEMPALLLEVCFVDSTTDCKCYEDHFDEICAAIADTIAGLNDEDELPEPEPEEGCEVTTGKVSWFGGPADEGVSDQESLAFIYDKMDAPYLFLPDNAPGTEGKGLARSLNPYVHYIAMRWDYNVHPKSSLLEKMALVRNVKTGVALLATPADWGPHESTDRIADISRGLMDDLELETDDIVEVTFPHPG